MTAKKTHGISAKDIRVRLDGRDIVSDVSLAVSVGELVGLVGPNGAGKTTLLRALLGLLPVARGSIELSGQDLGTLSAKDRGIQIAYMAQGSPVHWPLTVETLVQLGRLPHKTPWQKMDARDQEYVEAALKRTGMLPFRERNVTTLSGGEKARVMLARALAANTPFLFADEPAASLDPRYQLDLMHLLRASALEGQGCLITLHDLNLAQQFCDRLLVMKDGHLIAEGAPEDVLTDTLVADVFGIQLARWQENGAGYLVAKKQGFAETPEPNSGP